jgi:hypothetical protein
MGALSSPTSLTTHTKFTPSLLTISFDFQQGFDGQQIGSDGTVVFRGLERTSFDFLVRRVMS